MNECISFFGYEYRFEGDLFFNINTLETNIPLEKLENYVIGFRDLDLFYFDRYYSLKEIREIVSGDFSFKEFRS